jgi:hypothetical protein
MRYTSRCGRVVAPARLPLARLIRADPQPIAAPSGRVGDRRIADAADTCGVVVLGRRSRGAIPLEPDPPNDGVRFLLGGQRLRCRAERCSLPLYRPRLSLLKPSHGALLALLCSPGLGLPGRRLALGDLGALNQCGYKFRVLSFEF